MSHNRAGTAAANHGASALLILAALTTFITKLPAKKALAPE